MKREYGCYVLMLSYIDNERMDIGGNIYPLEGFIESKEFTKDIDIRFGLNGILWGKTCHFPYEQIDEGYWTVIKMELTDDLIKTDSYYNRYKFPNGSIVFSGDLKDAATYIIDHKNDDEFSECGKLIQPEEIAGSYQWLKKYNLL